MGSGVGFTQLVPGKLMVHGGRLSMLCSTQLERTTLGPKGTKTCSGQEKEQGETEGQ